MSTRLDLDLDFQDYTPAGQQIGDNPNTSESTVKHDKPVVTIKIPDGNQSSPKEQIKTGSSGSLFQSLLQNASNLTPSGMSEESLQKIIWTSNKLRQQQPRPASTSGFNWGLNYLSQYFDVDTNDILERILWSAVPLRKTGLDIDNISDPELVVPLAGSTTSIIDNDDQIRSIPSAQQKSYSYIERFIQSRPDFYGPFWISTTLIFAVALCSNIVSFVNFKSKVETTIDSGVNSTANQPAETISNRIASDLDSWHYSIDELNLMSSVIIFYAAILPTFLWFLFWFRGCSKFYTLTEIICAYGYSLSIFVPLTFLLMIQATIFRYVVTAATALLSGIVLTLSFLPIAKSDPQPASSHMILAIVPICHFGLAYVIHRIMLQ